MIKGLGAIVMKIKLSAVLTAMVFLALFVPAGPARAQTNRYAGGIGSGGHPHGLVPPTISRWPNIRIATRPPSRKNWSGSIAPDGTGECQDETFVKVLTEKGKRNNRTLSLSFMLPYSTVEVVKLEVIKPDGTIVPVDVAANSKETIDDSQMQMNIYDPNSRILQVNIPKVEIGDVVHSISRQTITRSFMPGEFAEENVFEDEGYIRHVILRSSRAGGPAVATHRLARRSPRHGPLLHGTGPDHGRSSTAGRSTTCRACLMNPPCRPTKWFCNAYWSAPRPTGRTFPNGTGT